MKGKRIWSVIEANTKRMRDKTGRIKGKRKLEIYAEYAVTENKRKKKGKVNE